MSPSSHPTPIPLTAAITKRKKKGDAREAEARKRVSQREGLQGCLLICSSKAGVQVLKGHCGEEGEVPRRENQVLGIALQINKYTAVDQAKKAKVLEMPSECVHFW